MDITDTMGIMGITIDWFRDAIIAIGIIAIGIIAMFQLRNFVGEFESYCLVGFI